MIQFTKFSSTSPSHYKHLQWHDITLYTVVKHPQSNDYSLAQITEICELVES